MIKHSDRGPSAPEALSTSSLYEGLFEHSIVLSSIAGFDHRFKYLNPAWEKTLGYSQSELKAGSFLDFVHPDDIEKTIAEAAKLAQGGTATAAFENRYRCADGSYKTLSWYAVGLQQEQLLYATALDVTEQRRVVEENTRLRMLHQRTGRIAKVGGWDLELGADHPLWSEEVYRIHEVSLDVQPDLNDAINYYPPHVRHEVQECVQVALSGGPSWDREWPFITAKGNHLWVRAQGEAECDNEGNVVRLRGTFQDITQRKQAETELERGESTLRALHNITADASLDFEERVSRLLRLGLETWALRIAIVSHIVGNDYKVQHSEAREFEPPPIGMSFDTNATYCAHVMVANGPQAFHAAGKSLIAEHPCYRKFKLESYIGTPILVDGEAFGTLNFSSPEAREPFSQRDLETIKLFAQWIGHELAQQNTLKRLARAKEDAIAASEAKSTFLAMMSHEIRTPMNGVLGNTQLLFHTPLNQEQLELVQTIRSSGEGLLAIINDLLDFSKIEAGKLDLAAEVFDLRSTLESVIDLFSAAAAQKGLDLILDVQGDLPRELWGDAGRIRQIMLNFVSNALKFTEQGQILVDASANWDSDDSATITLSVSDTGPGISKEGEALLFRAFEQVDNGSARRFGGTGLGLAISQRLAKLMGGVVGVRSKLGEGSTFWFQVRLRADWKDLSPSELQRSPPAPQPSPATTPSLQSLRPSRESRVLVVEDNVVNQKVARRMLEKLGCKVDMAENGREAVELTDRFEYDLVFMDCHMPEMDGYTATRVIRSREAKNNRPPLRIVALTANVLGKDQELCRTAGMDAFVSKPVRIEELSRALRFESDE